VAAGRSSSALRQAARSIEDFSWPRKVSSGRRPFNSQSLAFHRDADERGGKRKKNALLRDAGMCIPRTSAEERYLDTRGKAGNGRLRAINKPLLHTRVMYRCRRNGVTELNAR